MTSANASFSEIGAALRRHHRFVVVSHLRPDGDALGSQLALGLCLQALGKEVKLWNEDGMLAKLAFLPGSALVTAPPAVPEDFDVLVAVDTATHSRLGTPLGAIGRTALTINVDHHATNPRYGDLAYVDPAAPATGQIVYQLIRDQGLPLSADVAANLFVAISTDTGSFQYASTTAETYEITAALIRTGINFSELSRQLYDHYPLRRLHLLRALLDTLQLGAGNQVASFTLTLATAAALGVRPEDNEGLIDTIRAVDTVLAAIFFEELPGGVVRVSMRSKTPAVDVSALCARFGGGGHVLAAGARVRGDLAAVRARVLAAVEAALPASR